MRVDGLMIIDRKGVGPSYSPRALQLLVLAAWTICSVNPGKGIRRRLRLVGSIGSIGSIGSFCCRPNAKENAGSTGDEEGQN